MVTVTSFETLLDPDVSNNWKFCVRFFVLVVVKGPERNDVGDLVVDLANLVARCDSLGRIADQSHQILNADLVLLMHLEILCKSAQIVVFLDQFGGIASSLCDFHQIGLEGLEGPVLVHAG